MLRLQLRYKISKLWESFDSSYSTLLRCGYSGWHVQWLMSQNVRCITWQ